MAPGLPDLSTIDITPALPKGAKLITSYSENYVTVNNQKFSGKILLTSFSIGEFKDMKQLIELSAKLDDPIIIFGSNSFGEKDNFKDFRQKNLINIPCELMSYSSACRTFNILVQELRDVILVLVPNEENSL